MYLNEDSDHEVVAFTATTDRITEKFFSGLPLVPFETVATLYPPSRHRMFVAVGYTGMNRLRSHFYVEARSLGYELISYVSSRALVRSPSVGDNSCILDGAIIEPFATIGNDVIVWSGAHVSHHSTVGDHSFLGPGVTIASNSSVGRHCFLGVNATVRDSVSIADDCLIGAGALVLRDISPRQVLVADESRPYPGDIERFF